MKPKLSLRSKGRPDAIENLAKATAGYIILHNSGKFAGITFEVSGCMNLVYSNIGANKSWLGFPISDGYTSSSGARQDFENGYILWDSKTYQCRAIKN